MAPQECVGGYLIYMLRTLTLIVSISNRGKTVGEPQNVKRAQHATERENSSHFYLLI